MGKDLYDDFGDVRKLYDIASEALGYDVAAVTFNGPKEELNKTHVTQPCLLVASIAAHTALALKGVKPSVVAGHSLGEYSALVAAESLAFRDAVRITERRGRIMQEAVAEGEGLMAAVLGMDRKDADELCRGVTAGYVAVANYNCPRQIVLSGEKAAVEEAMKRAKEQGAMKVVPLAVSVPSHCGLMKEAGQRFESELKAFPVGDARVPFVNNTEARFISDAEVIRSSLVKQLSESVLWEDCVKTIVASGISIFVEVGPGRVLSGLIKRIDPSVKLLNVENTDTLNKSLPELRGN
jgi:[acyl-carrier-protein] S-malonyltransferase